VTGWTRDLPGAADAARLPRCHFVVEGQTPPIGHVLDCVAGVYRQESDALAALRRLASAHGLPASTLVLLRPADGAWLSFIGLARQWAQRPDAEGQPWQADRVMLTILGILLAIVFTAIWGLLDDAPTLASWALMFSLAATASGAAGAAVAFAYGRSPRSRAFDRVIRRHLRAGRWVVLAHDLPWQRQTEVVSLVKEIGVRWCAVSSARTWR
jgi:hypothetical protein